MQRILYKGVVIFPAQISDSNALGGVGITGKWAGSESD
jgi:hypothetical protein